MVGLHGKLLGEGMHVPLDEMNEQHSCSLLHRLDEHAGLWGHGRVCQLEWVEVHNSTENAVGGGGSGADEDRQAVQCSIYYEGIAMAEATG